MPNSSSSRLQRRDDQIVKRIRLTHHRRLAARVVAQSQCVQNDVKLLLVLVVVQVVEVEMRQVHVDRGRRARARH